MHVQQPLHLYGSTVTAPLSGSLYIAPVRQALTQEETVDSLHADAGDWPQALSLERLDEVLRGGMGKSTVDLAEAASHANVFLNIYPTHHIHRAREGRAATGCRMPLVSHTPRNLSIPAGTRSARM
jgi:hypothetical protein